MKITMTLLIFALIDTALIGCASSRAVRVPCDRHLVPINAPLAIAKHVKGETVFALSRRTPERVP